MSRIFGCEFEIMRKQLRKVDPPDYPSLDRLASWLRPLVQDTIPRSSAMS